MPDKIIVVEPMSTSFNYLEDIRTRGFEPVIIETYLAPGYARDLMDAERKVKYGRIDWSITLLHEAREYEETLRIAKAIDPILVIAGGEEGVVLATRLANDMGLIGNPYSNIDKMTKKSVMQQTLKEAGLRYIRGMEVASPEECAEFVDKYGIEDAVLKPVHGVASVGVRVSHGKEELIKNFRQEKNIESMFGENKNPFMVQERIFGDEYAVNTISRNGETALSSVFRCHKKQTHTGAIIYNGLEVITELNERERELVQYAFDTVKALGITDGPVHGEYMLDEKGPVLIEANCRVMGGSAPVSFLDKALGHHETDLALNCFLDEKYHKEYMNREYKPLRKGFVKDFSSSSTRHITSSGIIPILMNMKSYSSGWVENAATTDHLNETVDLETETGCIYMIHDDPEVTEKEYKILCEIEEHYPELFHSDGPLFRLPTESERRKGTAAGGEEEGQHVGGEASGEASGPAADTVLAEASGPAADTVLAVASGPAADIEEATSSDTETLIWDLIRYYKSGGKGPALPEELIEVNKHSEKLLDIIRRLCEI